MATQLQLRKGTKIQNDTFTGAQGELTFETDTKGLRIHDGATQGGFEVPVLVAVQRPTAANNYTWYRKYSDGWVEQGGIAAAGASSVVFPIEMADTNYCLVSTWRGNNTLHTISSSFSTTGCSLLEGQYQTSGRALTAPANWQVSGMAA